MPQAYDVTLYFDTGFNRGNIPDSPNLLVGFQSKQYDAVFEWQDRYLAEIRIRAQYDDVKNADYLKLGESTYYVINSVQALSPNTVSLDLTMDPLTTAGGVASISVLSGWAERAHATSDGLFENILPEPWTPSQRMLNRSRVVFRRKNKGEDVLRVVVATCDLRKTELTARTLTDAAESNGTVTYPELPLVEQGTPGILTMVQGSGNNADVVRFSYWMPPGMYLFDMDNAAIQKGLNAIRSIGIESAIVASYEIPKQYLLFSPAATFGTHVFEDGFISNIAAKIEVLSDDSLAYSYGTVKNKKALCLHNDYEVASISSGSTNSFAAKDIYNGDTTPQFVGLSDPASAGCPYFQPRYFDGRETAPFAEAVAGMPWLNSGIFYTTASGSALTLANAGRKLNRLAVEQDIAEGGYNLAQIRNGVSAATDFAGQVLGAGPNTLLEGFGATALNAVGTLANAGINAADIERQRKNTRTRNELTMGDNIFETNRALMQAPEVAFPVSVNASAYIGNAVTVTHYTLGDNDLKRFDKFLTMYGYAVDRAFALTDMTSRTKFNYVKTSDVHLKAATVPMNILANIQDMLNSGIRIWHVAPSQEAYDDNPVKEV